MATPANAYVIVGRVTDPDIAMIHSQYEGREVKVGDPEFRLVDDPVNPGFSVDFGSLSSLRRFYPDATLFLDGPKVEALRDAGFTVGERDPRVNRKFAGAFMVIEPHTDSQLPTDDASDGPWAVVGDDPHKLIDEAFMSWHQQLPKVEPSVWLIMIYTFGSQKPHDILAATSSAAARNVFAKFRETVIREMADDDEVEDPEAAFDLHYRMKMQRATLHTEEGDA